MHTTDPRLENYCLENSTLPSTDCERIFEYTQKNVPMSVMLVGPLEGSFLGWMVRAIKAKRVLEIGTFTGYSALCMAEHLPDDGELVTCDINPETTDLAKKFWAESRHGRKIIDLTGPALQSIQKLRGGFDLVFIDADKEGYPLYFEEALKILNPGGAILLDNCLRDGRVLDGIDTVDSGTKAIMQLTKRIKADPQLQSCLVPIRDGVLLVQKI